MSNWIDYVLDVLANTTDEINQIAARMEQPSQELASWLAQRTSQPVGEVAQSLKAFFSEFKTQNLFYQDDSVNKARQFSLSFKGRHHGIVDSHLIEVSAAFPKAVFLLEYSDMQASYSGKQVMRAGEIVQEVFDKDQKSQALDWALLDIFAPFRAEYCEEKPFGSLWNRWLEDIVAAAKQLLQEAKEKPV